MRDFYISAYCITHFNEFKSRLSRYIPRYHEHDDLFHLLVLDLQQLLQKANPHDAKDPP